MSSCVLFSSLRTLPPTPHTHKIMFVFRTTQADLDVSASIVTVTLTPVCLLETGQSAHDNYCPDEMSASPPYRGGLCLLSSQRSTFYPNESEDKARCLDSNGRIEMGERTAHYPPPPHPTNYLFFYSLLASLLSTPAITTLDSERTPVNDTFCPFQSGALIQNW